VCSYWTTRSRSGDRNARGRGCSGASGRGRSSRRRAPASTASDAEPVEDIVGLDGDVVVHTLSRDGLEVGTVDLPRPSADRRVGLL